MLQAPVNDCFGFDSFSIQEDGLPTPEVDIDGREVLQVFVITLIIVVADERFNLHFEIARQIVVLLQDSRFLSI